MASAEYEREILAWRKLRLARLTADEGWLSLVGKFELPAGEHRVGSDEHAQVVLPSGKAPALIGQLCRSASRVSFVPAPGIEIGVRRPSTQSTQRVAGPTELNTDAHGDPDRLVFGSLRLEVMQRGDSFAVRVRDTEHPARLDFHGIDYYPIRSEWRVTARLVLYQPEKRIDLLYETGSVEPYLSPGAAVFEWQGVEYRVDPVFDGNRPRLYVLFADQTNRDRTYGAGRFLYAPLPEDGRVILDFNQAFNPPCAFTAFAACPLPPPQNRLALRIEAGETRPRA